MPQPDTFKELRTHLDGQDPFMTHGHQIMKTRRPKKKIPTWVYNSKEIQKFLRRVFPKLKDPSQRERAGRWARVAHLYFNQNWSRGQIAGELHLTYAAVDSAVRALKRAAAGLRTDTGKAAGKPKGRPKKKMLKKKACLYRNIL